MNTCGEGRERVWFPCWGDVRFVLLLAGVLWLLATGGGCSGAAVKSGVLPPSMGDSAKPAGSSLRADSRPGVPSLNDPSPARASLHDPAFPATLPPQMQACLPARLHPVSGMFLKAWMKDQIGTPTFRRFFHMPNSDYLKVSECLVAVRKKLRAAAPREV